MKNGLKPYIYGSNGISVKSSYIVQITKYNYLNTNMKQNRAGRVKLSDSPTWMNSNLRKLLAAIIARWLHSGNDKLWAHILIDVFELHKKSLIERLCILISALRGSLKLLFRSIIRLLIFISIIISILISCYFYLFILLYSWFCRKPMINYLSMIGYHYR